MARVGGRNSAMAWIVGLITLGVVIAIAVLALPALPGATAMVGGLLRGANTVPEFVQRGEADEESTNTPACRALYTEGLWAQLTQRAGGDPVEDQSAPETVAASLVGALTPTVKVSCTFIGTNTGRIRTTIAEVGDQAAVLAQRALESAGYLCSSFGDGVRCETVQGTVTEEQVVRGGLWLVTVFDGWKPERYTDRVARTLWP